LLSFFSLTPTLFAASSQPFFLHFDVICAQPIGTGLNGELLLSITNISDEALSDIMVSLPQNSKFQFGTNNHSQAGSIPAGGHVVVRENLFDPEGISLTGSMTFVLEYTDASGNRQCVEVPAIGNVGGVP
jgi:hypothetical protein